MHTKPSSRAASATFAAAVALGLLAASPASRAASVYAATATTFDTRGPQRVCLDFFCRNFVIVPPQVETDSKSEHLSPNLQQALDEGQEYLIANNTWYKSVDAHSRINGAEATATVRTGYENSVIKAGVAAAAGIDSVFHSQASASLSTTYAIDVVLEAGGLSNGLVVVHGGAVLAVDFQHQTTGRFAFNGQPVPGAQASFSETLRVAGTGAQTSRAELQGQASLTTGPVTGETPTVQASGAWSSADFYAPLLGDDEIAWTFNHFHTIAGLIARFHPQEESLNGKETDLLIGRFEFTLEQLAQAGFTDPRVYRVGGGTSIAADFAHTSSFGLGRVYDPTGQFDLSGVRAVARFIETSAAPDAAALPEPASLGLVLAALGLGAWRRRATMRPRCPPCPGFS